MSSPTRFFPLSWLTLLMALVKPLFVNLMSPLDGTDSRFWLTSGQLWCDCFRRRLYRTYSYRDFQKWTCRFRPRPAPVPRPRPPTTPHQRDAKIQVWARQTSDKRDIQTAKLWWDIAWLSSAMLVFYGLWWRILVTGETGGLFERRGATAYGVGEIIGK